MDVTKPWPFNGLEYVYGEHFLEHLSLEGAIAFLDKILFYPTFRISSYIFIYIYIFKETYTKNLHYRTQY